MFNSAQVPNVAWSSFLVLGLGFSSLKIGIIFALSQLMGALGIWVYQKVAS